MESPRQLRCQTSRGEFKLTSKRKFGRQRNRHTELVSGSPTIDD